MPEQPAGEKTEDASPRRRQDARKKGTVAKSQDLIGALALLACSFLLPGVIQNFATSLMIGLQGGLLRQPSDLSNGSLSRYIGSILGPAVLSILPLIFGMMVVGLVANFGQVGFVLSAETLKPSFEKINPAAGLKRLFSRRSVVEGLKAMAKMTLFGYLVYAAISSEWGKIIGISYVTPIQAGVVLGNLMHTILIRVSMLWLSIAALDYFFQRKEVDRQLKMTKQELRQEMKEQEGSPEIKIAIAQRRRHLLRGGIARKVKLADVIITNPTHYAIAIQYDRSAMHAPMVVAKGQDFVALKMRELAKESGVPIVENKPLARALYKQCEAGDFVPRELFGSVAEVLAYVYKTVKRVRSAA